MTPSHKISKPFKNASGRHYLLGLFYETTDSDHSTAVYTLKDQDHLTYPSLYQLYMQEADPTEYRFAVLHLSGWGHWQELTECSWFQPYVTRWRLELETRLRSIALARIIDLSADTKAPASFQANKYLLDGSWKPAGEKKPGRPTKVAIQREAHRIASEREQAASDFERLIVAPSEGPSN